MLFSLGSWVSDRIENGIEAVEDVQVITGGCLHKSIDEVFNELLPRSVECAHKFVGNLYHCDTFELTVNKLLLCILLSGRAVSLSWARGESKFLHGNTDLSLAGYLKAYGSGH